MMMTVMVGSWCFDDNGDADDVGCDDEKKG